MIALFLNDPQRLEKSLGSLQPLDLGFDPVAPLADSGREEQLLQDASAASDLKPSIDLKRRQDLLTLAPKRALKPKQKIKIPKKAKRSPKRPKPKAKPPQEKEKPSPIPKPQPPPDLRPGFLEINVAPWGKVWVDGQLKAQTPPKLRLKLSPGRHQLRVENPGFPPQTEEVQIRPGESLKRKIRLRAHR